MQNLKKSSPWVEYYRQMEAFFKKDEAVKVAYDDEKKAIYLYVRGTAKAEGLSKILLPEKTFGNVTVTVNVVPSNDEESLYDTLRDAFYGNGVLSDIYTAPGPVLEGLNYVIFRAEVAQYFDDNLQDVNGNSSWLYQDLARELIADMPGIAFCTEPVSYELRKDRGEWP